MHNFVIVSRCGTIVFFFSQYNSQTQKLLKDTRTHTYTYNFTKLHQACFIPTKKTIPLQRSNGDRVIVVKVMLPTGFFYHFLALAHRVSLAAIAN